MTFTDKNKLTDAFRILLILIIGSIFVLFSLKNSCFAQSDKSVDISFLKTNDSIKASDLYFNVLKIRNNTSEKISGSLTFNGPQEWKIISFPDEQTILLPGDTISVPIRVSPSANALGGIAYIINATFRTSQKQISASTYLTIPPIVKWEFSTNNSSQYCTENNPNTTFQIRLSNKGNTNQSIKIKLEAGKLLTFTDNSPNNNLEYVTLKAFTDTTILRTITTDKGLTFAEKLRYENNWRESAVNISASTDQAEKHAAVQINELNSIYVNQRVQSSSPLNLDYQVYNLMSNQSIRNNFKMYGNILFPKNRGIQYFAGVQNFSFSNTTDQFDLDRQLVYTVRYTDNRSNLELGYNVNSGFLHSINGRGIAGTFSINRNNSISYGLTQNPYSKTIGELIGYTTTIKNLTLNTEVTHENKTDGTYEATSALLGASFTLFKYHSFSFQFLESKSDYRNTLPKDTSVLGYSYRVNYNVNYKKFNFRFSSLNSENNYILNSGLQQTNMDGRYLINSNTSVTLYGNHQKYAITRYPDNFYNPVNYNSNDNLRITTALNVGNLLYQIGPTYNGSIRQFYNPVSGYKSEYIIYQPGVWCALSIKLPGYKSITPNLTVSNIRFYYKTADPSLENYSFDKNVYYSAGLSYFDNVWRVNAYYTSGSTTDLYRSVLVNAQPAVARSIQLRPSYENFFFNRTVKLSAYFNYGYYMPSGRENVSFNLKYDQFFKKGWNLSVSGFMFSNTRVDDQQGRISTKDLNLLIGITKSFNIQQPRMKYYDFKAVFFNDLDGNKTKSNNEPPVTDILVNIEKDQTTASGQSNIPEIKLITDANGVISIENLPKDYYKLNFTPLINLQSLYFLNGSEQTYFNDKTQTMYIPLAESYKVKGKIILVRDPNSSEGKIELGGVRITATGQKGEMYSVLTDNFGAFVLSVPNADKYTIHINNVFGEQFNIDANETLVQFAQNKTINLDFTFIEKARGIQFDNGNELFKFNSLGTQSESAEITKETESAVATSVETPKNYAIQIATSKTYRDPSYFKNKYKLKDEVRYTDNGGVYTYYTGDYPTLEAAKTAINKSGLKALPVPVQEMSFKEAKPIDENAVTQKGTSQSENKSAIVANPSSAIKTGTKSPSSMNQTIGTKKGTEEKLQSVDAAVKTESPEVLPGNRESAVVEKGTINESQSPSKPVSINKPSTSIENDVKDAVVKTESAEALTGAREAVVAKKETVNKLQSPSKSVSTNKPTSNENNVKVSAVTNEPVRRDDTNPIVQSSTKTIIAEKNNQPTNTQVSTNQPVPVENPGSKRMPEATKQVIAKTKQPDEKSDISKSDRMNNSYFYTIQLDGSKIFRDPAYYKQKFGLPFEVTCVRKNGTRRYYAGKYKTIDDARADIARYGITGFIVSIEESGVNQMTPEPIKK